MRDAIAHALLTAGLVAAILVVVWGPVLARLI